VVNYDALHAEGTALRDGKRDELEDEGAGCGVVAEAGHQLVEDGRCFLDGWRTGFVDPIAEVDEWFREDGGMVGWRSVETFPAEQQIGPAYVAPLALDGCHAASLFWAKMIEL